MMPPARLIWASTTRARQFDGAWWPRSRELVAELSALLTDADSHLGDLVVRLSLNPTGWPEHPRRLWINGRTVRFGWFDSIDLAGVGIGVSAFTRRTLWLMPPELPDAEGELILKTLAETAIWPTDPVELLSLGAAMTVGSLV